MARTNKKIVIFLSIFSALIICGLGLMIWKGRSANDSEEFDAYMDRIFQEEISANTINLHYTLAYPENYGITDYEVTLGSYSAEEQKAAYQELEETRNRLLQFNASKLTEQQRLTYDILLDYIETELLTKELLYYREYLGAITGYQAQLPVILAEYTFRTKRDIQDYLELIAQMDEVFEEIMAFEREKAEAGLFMADYVADDIIAQCQEFIADPENNYMIEVFNDKIEEFQGLSEEEREAYRKENYEVVTTQVTDGYRTLIDGLTELKGSGTNELGLCYYEDGKEYYEYLVRTKTGSEDSVKKLQNKVESFMVNRLSELQMAILEEPQLYDEFMDYQYELTEPEEMLEDLKVKIEEDFPAPPQVDYTIRYVHPSMQEHMSPAFYLTTPIDDLKNNYIYINEWNAEEGNYLYSTLAHEGYPGHLYQNAYTNSSGIAPIRNLLSYSGYTEGWATYVEYEYSYTYMGMGEGLAELSAINNALSLGLYAYADMGIHYEGWDREELAEYLFSYGIADDEITDEVYDALIEEPANYLSYFIGYLEILDLREEAQRELGEAFDEKEFHAFLLELGPAPFAIIEEYMDPWMAEQ